MDRLLVDAPPLHLLLALALLKRVFKHCRKLYGLAWAFPEWLTCTPGTLVNCTDSIYTYPNQTAAYVASWISGAKTAWNLSIDYVGESVIN